MKALGMLFMVLLVSSPAAAAGARDFDWTRDFDIRAQGDPSGFRARLAARFKIGDADVDLVMKNVERPADAYILLRLGEISARPMDRVLEEHKSGRGKGWGNLAKSLGIKPGSAAFQALKRGSDMYEERERTDGKGKDKHKGKGAGKGKNKD